MTPRTPTPTPDASSTPEDEQAVAAEDERASFTTRVKERFANFREGLREGLPFPLWCQGALESVQAWALGALVAIVPALVAWFAGAWDDKSWAESLSVAAQWWLVAHGVPLGVNGGTVWFVPLALTLLPLLLAWRAGRRLARASWSDQLWQAIAGAAVIYAVAGFATGLAARPSGASAPWWACVLIPLITVLIGLIAGARREAGSFGRLIGVNAADWVRRTSQYSRWAGSYVWAVLRAGLVGWVAAFGLATLALLVRGGALWIKVLDSALALSPGPVGGAVLTAGQGVYLPNAAIWTLSWISGGGFDVGEGARFSPFAASSAPMPSLPVLQLLPTDLVGAYWVMALPVIAGVVAGWWFLREGENHLEEWMQLRFGPRWLALSLSTLLLGLFVGLVTGVLSFVASLLASGTLGIGVFTHFGPALFSTAGLLTLEIGVGAMIGYLLAPLFERDVVLDS